MKLLFARYAVHGFRSLFNLLTRLSRAVTGQNALDQTSIHFLAQLISQMARAHARSRTRRERIENQPRCKKRLDSRQNRFTSMLPSSQNKLVFDDAQSTSAAHTHICRSTNYRYNKLSSLEWTGSSYRTEKVPHARALRSTHGANTLSGRRIVC